MKTASLERFVLRGSEVAGVRLRCREISVRQVSVRAGELTVTHLVEQRAHQGVGSLLTEEPLRVVQEDLMETVEDVLKQQTVLLFRVKQQLV